MIRITTPIETRIVPDQILRTSTVEDIQCPFTAVHAENPYRAFVPGNGAIEIEYCEAE